MLKSWVLSSLIVLVDLTVTLGTWWGDLESSCCYCSSTSFNVSNSFISYCQPSVLWIGGNWGPEKLSDTKKLVSGVPGIADTRLIKFGDWSEENISVAWITAMTQSHSGYWHFRLNISSNKGLVASNEPAPSLDSLMWLKVLSYAILNSASVYLWLWYKLCQLRASKAQV